MPGAAPAHPFQGRAGYRRTCVVLACALFAAPARAADPQPYSVTIAKTGDAALDGPIADSSELASLRGTAPVGPFALLARARGDADRVTAALGSQGFYAGSVVVRVNGRALDDPGLLDALERSPANPPASVSIDVTPGPRFTLRRIVVDGAMPAKDRAALGLTSGAPAAAGPVLAARGRLQGALQEDGFALAQVDAPVATLDPAARALDVTFAARPGPRVDLGPVTVAGLVRMKDDFVRDRLLVHQGDRFSTSAVEKARADLANLGVFSSVRAVPAPAVDRDGQLPLAFDVAERPLRAVSATIGYSTDLGVTGQASWRHRNLFGRAEQLNLTIGTSQGGSAQRAGGYSAAAQFIKPDFLARDQNLQVDLGAIKQSLLAYDQTAVTADVLLTRKFSEHWSGSIGVAGEQETIKQEGVRRDYTLVGLPVGATYDSTDSLLDPTRGLRANASVTPTESLRRSSTFVLTQASASTYFDLAAPGRTVLALRGLVGDALGVTQFDLPPDKRFYAGGSASVRGYKYQSVGPRFADFRPQGGTSVAAGTVELRQRFGESWGAAAFLDAGQVAAKGGPFSGQFKAGAGVGARYYTAIGPIRVDVAVPLDKRRKDDALELYIGIGQAF